MSLEEKLLWLAIGTCLIWGLSIWLGPIVLARLVRERERVRDYRQ